MSRSKPYRLGYRMPAEWEAHEATWLSWPKDPLTFPPEIIEKVEASYIKIVHALALGELVEILVDDEKAAGRIAGLLGRTENVRFRRIRTVDVWIRDYGPIFVKGKDVAATKWRFNAWGNKYEELRPDDAAGMEIAKSTGQEIFRTDFILEGGSIDVNGAGACITTEQCLLNKNRGPGRTKRMVERVLREYLGASKLIWLSRGIEGDDTDGHVDDIARFVDRRTVVSTVEDSARDKNHRPLRRNLELLGGATDQDGKGLRVLTIPMPKKIGGEPRLPASYANFYIGNSVVLVPTFSDTNDKIALGTISEGLPDREVLGIDCRALVYGFGGIHCVTQQQPLRSA